MNLTVVGVIICAVSDYSSDITDEIANKYITSYTKTLMNANIASLVGPTGIVE